MISFLFTILLFAGDKSFAEDPRSLLCPTPSSFIEEIYNCGQNKLAALYAQNCSNALLKKSRATGKSLSSLMAELEKLGQRKQDKAYIDEKNRLALTIAALKAQIEELKRNTDVVASYTNAMIDFPDGVDDESSAECFNSAFHSLQKTVDGLDLEIQNSEAAYAKAKELFASEEINTDMGSLSENDASWISVPNRVPATQPAKAKRRESTISGKIRSDKLLK